MDTTFVTIILIVFLVIAGLAIDIGYMYVGEEELQHVAETAALAGAQSLKQRLLAQIQHDPARLPEVLADPVQAPARKAASEAAAGNHHAAALVEVANDNSNALGSTNDITFGFWNFSTHRYTPGGNSINAMQVRARRTAESETVGLGSIGVFISRISGIESHNFTPVVTAAFTPRARAGITLSPAVCSQNCTYPNVCVIPERRMVRSGWSKGDGAANRFAFTALKYQVADASGISPLVCNDIPSQEVCGQPVYVTLGEGDTLLRDLESAMYNPEFDKSNKEVDPATGKIVGWWVIVPMTENAPVTLGQGLERHMTTKYALVRISRICSGAAPGCGRDFSPPAGACAPETGTAFFIDRISCSGCGSKAMFQMLGLQPSLVK